MRAAIRATHYQLSGGMLTVLVTHDVDEATALADRIFLMSNRPMRIERLIGIDIPHPRSMADPRVVAYNDSILHELGALEH